MAGEQQWTSRLRNIDGYVMLPGDGFRWELYQGALYPMALSANDRSAIQRTAIRTLLGLSPRSPSRSGVS